MEKLPTAQKIYIDDPERGKGGRFVGILKETPSGLVLRKNVIREKHLMGIHFGEPMYGIQKEVFDKYLRGKRGRIEIKELDTGRFLVASIETWTNHSSAKNYGYGKQVFLPVRFMHGADNFSRETISSEIISVETRLAMRDLAEEKGIYKSRDYAK